MRIPHLITVFDRKDTTTASRSASTCKHLSFRFDRKSLEEDGSFAGYGAVFGNEDLVGDVIKKGAFKRHLREYKAAGMLPKFLWQHDTQQPIGVFTSMKEDDTGLYVEGMLALKTRQGAEAHELLKMGAIDGLSIGYWPVEWKWDDKTGVRTLLDVDLYEVSLVTFPANPEAAVDSVKAAMRCKSIRDFEAFLRDEGGFSHAAAKAIASSGFKAVPTPRDEDGFGDLLASITRAGAVLK